MKLLKQILFIATCWVLLVVGTSANAALPDHSWHYDSMDSMGICPSNPANKGSNLTRENPYCLTDLDGFPLTSYGYSKWGNLLSAGRDVQAGLVTLHSPQLTFSNLTDYISPTTNDLFVNCGLSTLSPATIPVTATWVAPSATADGKLTLSPSPCGLYVDANLFRKLHFNNTLNDLNAPPIGPSVKPVGSSTQKAIILIHGWNKSSTEDKYKTDEFRALVANLKSELAGTEWSLILYHWEADADTGGLRNGDGSQYDTLPSATSGVRAAEIAHQHGQHLGELLANLAPDLEKVHFIAHSAGSWAARSAALYLAKNPSPGRAAPLSQITLLDPFIPGTAIMNGSSGLGLFEMYSYKVSTQNYNAFELLNGIYRLENYWARDISVGTDNPTVWNGGTKGINQRIDIGGVSYCLFYCDEPMPGDGHSQPIQFYADTITNTRASLNLGNYPLTYLQQYNLDNYGWPKSIFYNEPQVTSLHDVTTAVGGNATFSVTGKLRTRQVPSSDNSGISFHWQECNANNVCTNMNVAGPTLTIGPVTLASNGRKFRAVAENPAGFDTSNIVTLTVQSAATAPAITAQPQNQTAPSGTPTVQFDVAATGTNLAYQWRKDGAPISGETHSSLTLYNITAADAGSYTVVVTNSVDSVTSTPATLTVSAAAVAPEITLVMPATLPGLTLPQRQLITLDGTGFTANSRLTFTVGATTYANRVPVLVNNQLQYNIAVGNPAQTQNWTVKVVNGAQVSNAAPFTVTHSADTTLPQIKITGIERTAPGIVHLSGTAMDDVGVTGVTWSTDQGASGTASYSFGRWNIPGMTLAQGANVITVSAADAAGHVGTDTVTLSPAAPGANLSTMQIVARHYHTVALKSDGTVEAWGYNFYGQLGDGTTTDRLSPVAVPGLTGVVAVATGDFHTVALKSDGTVVAWGSNGNGELGDGTTTQRLSPVAVPELTGVVAVSAGGSHTVALKSDGTVVSWGNNVTGQLGDGTTTQRSSPVAVPGLTGVVAVAAGGGNTVALKSDGTVMSWGFNYYGQLGDGTTTQRSSPVAVPGLTGVVAVATGGNHTVALKADGTVVAWGMNDKGQLGDGTTTTRYSPVAVPGLAGVAAVSVGYRHTMALKADGTVVAWGGNYYGELGDGTTIDRLSPVVAPGFVGMIAVSAGDYYTVALKADGTVVACGYNTLGQLGDNTTTHRLTPVQTLGAGGTGFLNLATSAPFFGNPVVSLSATSLTFTTQDVGSTSAAQTLTLTNSGTGSLSLNNIAASGDFAVTHNCPASLAAGANCAINVAFTPLLAGTRDGLLTIWSDAPDSPQMVSLTGTGNGTAVATLSTTTSKLNDTGITASQCYQAGSDVLVACNSAGALALNNAQDGMAGRDANAATNSNTDGKLGFSFAAVTGGCVQDNVTGLMWEVKTTDGGLRDWNKTYTNYSATYDPNFQYGTPTDASGFVAAVNATNLCGYSDWRMPTADELQSIVDYGVAFPGPTIDATWFPNTQGSVFWSASPVVGTSDSVWSVSFGDGTVAGIYCRGCGTEHVRLVRSGQPHVQPRYTVSTDGQEVTDNQTKLIWRRCAEGMVFSGGTCTGTASIFTHEAALQLAAAQASSTGIAWRLPNIKELSSIADRTHSYPAIAPTAFPALTPNAFWSASPYSGVGGGFWGVDFGNGFVFSLGFRNFNYYVQLVRYCSNNICDSAYAPPQDGITHFPNQAVGSTSAAQAVTFINSGTVALGIGNIAANGDFLATHSCPATLAPGANCSINVQFAPTAPGNRTGILTVSSPNGTVWSNTLLSGTGMSPVLVLSSSALNFAPQALNTVSATQPIALTNTGNAALNITSIAASGDYAVTHNCGTSLAAGANCAMSITFTPTAAGTRSGTLSIATNAAGSPYSVTLSGDGVTPPATTFTASATAGANGSITPASQTVTQGNTASFTVTPDTGYTASVSGCGGSLNGGIYTTGATTAGCTVSATFTPSAIQISLVTGWNLLGNSVNAPLDVAATLGDAAKVTTVWKWMPEASKWAFYAPSMTAPNLATYAAGKGYDVLATINGGEGFWVNAKTAFTVQLPAGAAVTTISFQDQLDSTQNKLLKGWNLVAMGDNVTPSVFNHWLSVTPPAQGVIPLNVTTLWAWDSTLSNWYFYAPSLEASGGLVNYITGKNYLDFGAKTLDPAMGFWVNKP